MTVRQYKKSHAVQAIQFQNTEPDHVHDIINFVGLPISVDYTEKGVRLRVIRGALDVLVASLGDYLVMQPDGKLEHVKEADFDYVEVSE
jgi:hypothetical protein